jgi:hypothetical protein
MAWSIAFGKSTKRTEINHDRCQFFTLFTTKAGSGCAKHDSPLASECSPTTAADRKPASITASEAARECHARAADDHGKQRLQVLAIRQIKRRPSSKLINDRIELDLFVKLAEFPDTILQALGNRQIKRPDRFPTV